MTASVLKQDPNKTNNNNNNKNKTKNKKYTHKIQKQKNKKANEKNVLDSNQIETVISLKKIDDKV